MAMIINPFQDHIVKEIIDEDEANNHFVNEVNDNKPSMHQMFTVFVTSTWMEQGSVPPSSSPSVMLKEATHVITCGYEDKTEWGLEIGWIYIFITENNLRGFKMHSSSWRSFSIKKKEPGPTTFERMGKWSFHEYFVAWNTLIAVNFILLLWLLWKNLLDHPKDQGRQNETRG
ncbi:unnamed protein product [Malus baccata var. baccata]